MGVEAAELLGAVDAADLPAVLAVVVDEHVLGDAEQRGGVHLQRRGHRHLEPPHVPRVPRILKAVLVALEEELELEPGTEESDEVCLASVEEHLVFNTIV